MKKRKYFTRQVNHRNLRKRKMTILLFNHNIQDLLLEWALIGKHLIVLLSITIAVIAEMKVNHWMKTLRYANTHAYAHTCIHRHTICVLYGEPYQYTRCQLKREQRDKSKLIN